VPNDKVLSDGSFDFSRGVNSDAVVAVQSDLVPHGLRRDQLAWLSNGTVRGGIIQNRNGFFKLLDVLNSGLYQGGFVYEPIPDGNPYLMLSISGRIYKVLLDPPYTVTDISAVFGLTNPATVPEAFFVEAEGILCIQAGDLFINPPGTKPLFYHNQFGGTPEILRRSNGLTGNVTYPNINEIPAALAMEYYAGRLWYSQGRILTAGDIVGNQTSGTANYNFRDSVFKVTENPLATGGDGFTVPSQAGNIRALKYIGQIDTSLGQGPLYVFTRKQIYSFEPPINRTAWIAANNNTQPFMKVANINNGAVGERGIIRVNGDLYFQQILPAINSFLAATRYFGQPGNVPISRNVNRVMDFQNRAIMRFNSGVEFDNRGLNGVLPKQLPQGVVTQGIIPLNFDSISSLEEREAPCFEGLWEGLDTLQHFTGDFGGLPRAFSVAVNRQDQTIDVWELSDSLDFENGDNRIEWYAEFPAYTWSTAGWELELKELMGGELWIDRVQGTVDIKVEYRPDADPCWHLWFATQFCAARNCAEDINTPVCYPVSPNYRKGYSFPITLPKPTHPKCRPQKASRPADIGMMFQPKVSIKGACRIRGLLLKGAVRERGTWEGLKC
jgi:hypothetical protein